MNEYNERWTREKFLEYRKLKRSGYSHEMLIEHFGEDIYHSGLYIKNGSCLPNILMYGNFINEIKITPEQTTYDITPIPSNLEISKMDYILTFISKNVSYTICLMYYKIYDKDTYNIVFTTTGQWNEYRQEFLNISKKGNIDEKDWVLLNNIISRETNLNDLFPVIKKLSWIILDFYHKYLKGELISIGDTNNKIKIKLYRNIIENSFNNIEEKEITIKNNKYYIYKINE